ncbi:hypothetical protein Hdeb2414_s0087g00785951 [Helianthus debilis subsp. tardiflorus]
MHKDLIYITYIKINYIYITHPSILSLSIYTTEPPPLPHHLPHQNHTPDPETLHHCLTSTTSTAPLPPPSHYRHL